MNGHHHLITKSPQPLRWLIVDDNRDILAMLQAVLTPLHLGQVECFDSPLAAFAAFTAAPDAYEMVITDFEMPGMDGIELCRRLRALVPALKVFLATGSGFFTEAAAHHAGFCALLNKPFPISDLKRALVEAGVPTKNHSLPLKNLRSEQTTTTNER